MEDIDLIWAEKYRPASFEDMVLSDAMREILNKFVKEDMIPHLLLTGNVGCGKTTIAKIFLDTLDCESITLNASNERGIDVIRDKIMQFAMMSSLRKFKIVFLDEADALTSEAQFAMRNLMETYSDQTRFILTCNYVNRILEPIRSRCQVLEFQELGKNHVFKFLTRILTTEKITFDKGDLLTIIDLYYPDIRTMLNTIQLNCINKVLNIKHLKRFLDYSDVVNWIKKGDYKNLRQNTYKFNFLDAFRYLFDRVDEFGFTEENKIKASLSIAEYMYRSYHVADQEINFSALCLELMLLLGVKLG